MAPFSDSKGPKFSGPDITDITQQLKSKIKIPKFRIGGGWKIKLVVIILLVFAFMYSSDTI